MSRTYSILRDREYEELSKLTLYGGILDIGGNKSSEYHSLIQGKHTITTVNLTPEYGCDLVFDIQEKFPLDDSTYDNVISMNVLEHVYGFQNAFSEIGRILKKDGTLILSTPFMHHIHGCPDDYFRYTDSALEKILTDAGFHEIEITPIGLGIFSLFYQTTSGMIPRFLERFFKAIALGCDWILLKVSKRYARVCQRIPLGYFVTAKKD